MKIRSLKGYVAGRVQGVGFRYFVQRHALAEQITGYTRNLDDGGVEFLLQGEAEAVARVVELIRVGPGYARVSDLCLKEAPDSAAFIDFVIR